MFTLTLSHLEKYTLDELTNPLFVFEKDIRVIDLDCDIVAVIYGILNLFHSSSNELILLVSKFVSVNQEFILNFSEEDYEELNEYRMKNMSSEKDKIIMNLSADLCCRIQKLTGENINYHTKSFIEDKLMRISSY